MTQRFEKAYNALLKAFMDDTLAKGSCTACAIGNIVADAMGAKVSVYKNALGFEYKCDVNNSWWSTMFMTTHCGKSITTIKKNPNIINYRKRIKELTGYTWKELAKVEFAFEQNTKIVHSRYCDFSEKEIMEDQFNGLMAVMDVLIKLDDVKEGEKYKNNFKNKLVKA